MTTKSKVAANLTGSSEVGETETLLEVTDWSGTAGNHTYLVDKRKQTVLAYRKASTGEIVVFSRPLKQWSRSKRKFKRVVDNELESAIL